MRIGFLTYGLDRYPTGIGRYASQLLDALVTLPDAPEIVLLTTECEDRQGFWRRFEHHHLPGCRLLPSLMTLGGPLIAAAAHHYHLDLVHDPNGIAPFLTPGLSIPTIVTIHDVFAYVYPEAQARFDAWRSRTQLPLAARRATIVLTDSENSRKDILHFLRINPQRLRAIPLATEQRFKPVVDFQTCAATLQRYKVRQPYLLYVGGINARKNIIRLLEAFALVHRYYPALTLVIGGKRQWRTEGIDQALGRLNLESHVHFTGYLADTDLPALYSAAKAFVFPSLYEGFGLPPLEAMACGTPVITSNASSLPEVVGEAAIMVDPYDVEGLAAAIARVLDDALLRADLRTRGLQRAALFSWERTARETIAVYEQAMAVKHTTRNIKRRVKL